MAIKNLQEKFIHELGDIYDAEHQFLKGQEQMLQNATDPNLQQMISQHIEQTRQQISNLEQVYSTLGQKPERVMCDGAKGIVSEGQKMLKEISGSSELRDCAIAGSASKVEHYEISTYRGLITGAELMGQQEIVSLLQENLEQEESTAMLIEQSTPTLLQKAMQAEGLQGQFGASTQAYPTY
jgi:ferritin-like metal-binding protein YciE